MEDRDVTHFDADTPKISDASKVRSILAVNGDTEEVGAVEFDMLVLEAGKKVGDAVKITGNVLPELGDVNKYAEVYGGADGRTLTYGGQSFELEPDTVNKLFWDGDSKDWSLDDDDRVDLPGDPPTNEYDTETDKPLSGIAVGKGISKNFSGGENNLGSAEDVKKLNMRVGFFDRPDLPYFYPILNSRNEITDRVLSENRDSVRMLPNGTSITYYDRPDLGAIILVDKNNRYLGDTSTGGGGINPPDLKQKINLPVFNPGEQTGFDRDVDDDINSYPDLINYYDGIMSQANVNPNITPYVTKRSIGTSVMDNHEIYLYSFTPPDPKAKVLLFAGTHASEKMYIHVLKSFVSDLALNWVDNIFLDFLRWNIQIDILPCRMPYNMGNEQNWFGARIAPETAPIPFSWTKNGAIVTLTFNVSDFPDDGFLSGDNYFTAVPATALIGKQRIGIRTSSNETALQPDAYTITEIVSGNSLRFETTASGDASGTGIFQIYADPNRNIPLSDGAFWNAYYTATTALMGDSDGVNFGNIVSKGTRPRSLKENRHFMSLIESENYDYAMDLHAAGGDCYLSYDPTTGFIPDIEKMLSQSGAFVASNNDKIFDNSTNRTPFTGITLTREYDTPMHTVEWGSGLIRATGEQVRDAYRWMVIVLTESLLRILNK